jgi:hypothetical protein
MSNLLMLIVMVIASVGVAALILRLSEIIIITVPVMLTQAVKGRHITTASSSPAAQLAGFV